MFRRSSHSKNSSRCMYHVLKQGGTHIVLGVTMKIHEEQVLPGFKAHAYCHRQAAVIVSGFRYCDRQSTQKGSPGALTRDNNSP